MLKIMAAGAVAGASPRLRALARESTTDAQPMPITPELPGEDAWELHGRVIQSTAIYQEPSAASSRVAVYARDQSLPILGEVRAPFSAHNDLWYESSEGYAHSAWILPVRVYPEQPFIQATDSFGFWGQVAQVHTEGYTAPSTSSARKYRFYGGTIYRVMDSYRDEAGTEWYKVFDDYPPRQRTNHQWVLAKDIRRVPRSEMLPIHPFVGDKRIEIDLQAQHLDCYEGDELVFSTAIASGRPGLNTPRGNHCVTLKQPSRHMSNVPYAEMREGDRLVPGDIFDLPGIPWVVFFDLAGTAIHGVYWHNDFGVRRSSGCVNVSIDAASWIYRWVHPIGGYRDDFIRSNCQVGTPVIVR